MYVACTAKGVGIAMQSATCMAVEDVTCAALQVWFDLHGMRT